MKTPYRLVSLAFVLTCFALCVQGADYTYITNNGTLTITRYHGPGGVVAIPDNFNGLPVAAIGDSAFNEDTTVTSVTIPDGVTSIGDSAFYRCFSLTNVIIGKSVSSIADWAFSWCTNLTRVKIPDSVKSIGRSVFNYCPSLIAVNIPNGVRIVEGYTFYHCARLATIVIPDSVVSIGNSAFAWCKDMTNAVIGNSVATLGDQAFYFCTSLTGVYFAGNAPSPGADVFDGATMVTVYHLPGTIGWGPIYGNRPAALWRLPYPVILTTAPSFGVRTNRFGFIISWATNVPVVVEASLNLSNVMLPLSTNSLTDGWSYFSDQQWTNYPARFYRLRSP
jgi:hypothetical protein